MTENEIREVLHEYEGVPFRGDPRVVAMADQLLALLKPWIPVGERLPDDENTIIGYHTQLGAVPVSADHVRKNFYEGRVTYWMPYDSLPLPPPPAGEG